MLCYCVLLLCCSYVFFIFRIVLGVLLFYAHHCLFFNALLCCSALCYCTLFRVVLCSPCVKNIMNCAVLLCSFTLLFLFFFVFHIVLSVPLFYAHHCLFCNALLCCSALCYCTLFRVVLCSPCVKNTMNSTAPQNMQVAFKFCSSVGDLTLFLPSVILFFRPSAPFSFSCRNYYTSFIALW